jgi:DNA-binding transcriptional LysR family regulator
MSRPWNELPNISAIVAFEATARHMSLKKAAQELNVTPGAISKQIKRLEAELGVAVFVREHRAMGLTTHGDALFHAVTSGLGEMSRTCQSIRAQSAVEASISVGCTTAFAQLWLMPRLGVFWRDHKDVTINHLLSDTGETVPWGRINLHIRYGDGKWPGEQSEVLFDDRIYPVCSPDFARQHRAVDTGDIGCLPLLQLQGVDPAWTDWKSWLRMAGIRTGTVKTRAFSSYVVALQAAQNGQGLALGWHRLVEPLIEARRLQPFCEISVAAPHQYYLTWRAGSSMPAPAEAFRDWLLATARAETAID